MKKPEKKCNHSITKEAGQVFKCDKCGRYYDTVLVSPAEKEKCNIPGVCAYNNPEGCPNTPPAKKKEWELALLEKIKEEVGNMRHYSLCHRIDAHGCSFVGKFHGTKEELAERIQAVEELLRILNNLK